MTMTEKTTTTGELATPGLEGVVVAETAIGDVRGLEGFYHYRQYSAVELAANRTFDDLIELMLVGTLPSSDVCLGISTSRQVPPRLSATLPLIATVGAPLDVLRSVVSLLGAESDSTRRLSNC